MRIKTTALAAILLAFAGTAAAAGSGSVSIKLFPNKPSKASKLTVSATGPFSQSGLPTSVQVTVQKGFKSSAKAVKVLCTTTQASNNACPAKSNVGSGTAVATVTILGSPNQDTVTFTEFLGKKQKKGDVASVVIVGTDSLAHATAHAVGRLFKPAGGGLELLFSKFPSFSLPPGTSVTLNTLQLTAGAKRTVKKGGVKRRYSLITNPPKCTGSWVGMMSVTFTSGTFTKALSAPCRS